MQIRQSGFVFLFFLVLKSGFESGFFSSVYERVDKILNMTTTKEQLNKHIRTQYHHNLSSCNAEIWFFKHLSTVLLLIL